MTAEYVSVPFSTAALAATICIYRRHGLQYPIVLIWLLSESFWCFLDCFDHRTAVRCGVIPCMIMRAVVVLDSARMRLGPLVWPHRIAIGIFALLFCSLATVATYVHLHLNPWESTYAFRQYYYLILMVGPWTVIYGTRRRLSLAGVDRRAYSIGVAWVMTVQAVSGMIIRGGLGHLLLPRTDTTWMAVRIAGHAVLTATALYLAWRMCQRPRKQAVAAVAVARQIRRAA